MPRAQPALSGQINPEHLSSERFLDRIVHLSDVKHAAGAVDAKGPTQLFSAAFLSGETA